ncbi:baseplate megatron protein TIM-barrel domain-containing protein [Celeribacter halophilus]|uniref:Phage portal protein n=1 Tax=Celeribacter halophilus TaxID=576117 RepID=A0A1I3PXR7_9RHOB|nr:glycoside hydrolase TIM-barrel-like domain-containing protein [Celeribacter halophilus]PZX13958.1 phage portal protein [Celeribacter halophilus]SFJ26112.1 Phage portal protein [Celeribacter halophilus]
MVFDFLKLGEMPETKASATGPVVAAVSGAGRVAWSPRDTVTLTRVGFVGNPVGFRAVKLISEAASALPLILQNREMRFDDHPLLRVISRPNPAQGRAELFEALYAQIRTPITDGAYQEDWVYRYKDIRNWWLNDHHERINGQRSETPTAWVPQSKPVWFTELGCAAVDKATNQPNKFLDEKSSESSLPAYSNGRRDDFIQLQYLRAMTGYWGAPENNPVSEVYGGPMIDMSRAHVWAWDARPYPAFPSVTSVWSDGDNYAKGHWLNGRSTARSLADVVAEICARSGVEEIDTSALWGVLRGYNVSDIAGARSALQPLMLAYGFEAIEREGKLIFRSRDGKARLSLSEQDVAVSDELDGVFERTRAPEAEVAGRVQLTFVDADGDYGARAEEASFPDEESRLVSQSELPLALTRAEGRQVVERWLAESRIARDTARFCLPPSRLPYGAGDVIAVETDEGVQSYRIDQATLGAQQLIEAVRVEPEVYTPSDMVEEIIEAKPFAAPVPVYPLFLDLPLLTGEEVPHAPHIAVTGNPWPGSAAVYAAPSDSGYTLNTLVPGWATIGVTQTALGAARAGLWDRGPVLRVKLVRGELASVDPLDVLNGANVAAIGDGSSANWEVFQFANAELVAENTYDLSLRLRGQAGTDGLDGGAFTPAWPEGSRFVLIDTTLRQIDLAQSARGLARHYRIGPSSRAYDDASYEHYVEPSTASACAPMRLCISGPHRRPPVTRSYAGPAARAQMATHGSPSKCPWGRRLNCISCG